MKVQIIKIGRPAFPEIKALVRMYETRLNAFVKAENVELKDPKSATTKAGPLKESASVENILVVLDERGKEWTSVQLADKLRTWTDDPRIKNVRFVIGGPFGLDDATRSAAHAVWSLSAATMPSDLAWLVCWEQVYRAYNIIKGTSYHHE